MQILFCVLIIVVPSGAVMLCAILYSVATANRRRNYARLEFERIRELIS